MTDESVAEETKKTERIEFSSDERKSIIRISREIKHILEEDQGAYIINCFECIPEVSLNRRMFDQLVKSLQYNYSGDVVQLILSFLINSPSFVYEIKKIIHDNKINDFIDKIKNEYGYRISKLYSIYIGERDWRQITSSPVIRDNGIALTVDTLIANGEVLSFTAPLRTLPILSYHFLRHMNRTIDLLKERAILEIPIEEVEKNTVELRNLLERLEEYEKKKNKKE